MEIQDFSSRDDINSTENNPSEAYDPMKELKAFDATKAGVKGLVDAGVEKIPRMFHRRIPVDNRNQKPLSRFEIPTIDSEHRKKVVEQIRDASEKWVFFQVVNHGFPQKVMDEMTDKFRAFNEQPSEVKAVQYGRYGGKKPTYCSNFDLYQAPSANWRDSFSCTMVNGKIFWVMRNRSQDFPILLRDIIFEYSKHAAKLASELLEFLSEGLGLDPDFLNEVVECDKGHSMVCHYYPGCTQPELTMGTTEHFDPTFTELLGVSHFFVS